ncbi:hypothetical protein BG57_17855 [Caballeronia grimmiae]|uniref:Uncharacterized protein n=1 Tax=Caballeronia grimmiae TaxID=1071679 RepID=A0A069NX43_9BURK|nr:hypothetical protein BG57_17855 [Caballeronia grimmiae]GGD96125.1 hypothetical protein GCM10010985_58420 [Caballeronia grimmiae]
MLGVLRHQCRLEQGLRATLQSERWHPVANKIEAAYHRTDLFEQRRPLTDASTRHVPDDS